MEICFLNAKINMNRDFIEKLVEVPQVNYFFESYRQEDWPELILDLTLYSIYALRSQHQSPPPISYLQDIVRKAGMIISLEQAFPNFQKKLSQIKEDIIRVECELQSKKDEERKENLELKTKMRWSSMPSKNHLNKTLGWREEETKRIVESIAENKPSAAKNIFKDAPSPKSRNHREEEGVKENYDYGKSNRNEIGKNIYPFWWPKQTSVDEENKETTANIAKKKTSHFKKSKKSKFTETNNYERKNSSTILKQKSCKKASRNQINKGMTLNKKIIQYSDKSNEAHLISSKSSIQESHTRFNSKSQKNPKQVGLQRQTAWVQDFSNVIKRSPSESICSSRSPSESSQNSSSYRESPHFFSPTEAPNPMYLQNSQDLKSFSDNSSSVLSEYTPTSEMQNFFQNSENASSALTDYTPTSEMKSFYRNLFSKTFESKGTESRESRFKTENSFYSSNPSEEAGSLRYERKDSSFNSSSKTRPMRRG
ncbi:unnamed protein product [Blepharisma stoltei]|uniref:Uncharacterized protein n=1 Tax=Blepharisma stoltei TaxID=1481888 RepID=A0AAU9JJY1_9CILI|nr:unnamed protein product [Blepharisma stoltei]